MPRADFALASGQAELIYFQRWAAWCRRSSNRQALGGVDAVQRRVV